MSAVTQNESMLAKLLAMENIIVRRDGKARTASFDVKNRVLTMPVWNGISRDLSDLLTVHEVGHALDTPCDGWIDAIKWITAKNHTKPTSRQTRAVQGFLNVIEDARIDKRQKRRYPGSRRNYLAGYKELIERGFFGPASRDFNSMNFIDRLNIYFKGGFATIKFSPEEMPFVKRIENAETFEEVITLTDEVYAYCKAKGEESQRQTSDDVEYDDFEEMEGEGDGESFDDFEESDDGEDDEERSGNSSDDDSEEDDTEEDGESDDGESNDEESEDSSEDRETNDSDEGSSGDPTEDYTPESETEKEWAEKQEMLASSDTEYVYVTIPKPNFEKIVDDYKVFLEENEAALAKVSNKDYISLIASQFQQFKKDENNSISFMVKEFEMKKSADLYAKISVAKTGVIDTNKLHSYKYNDDIFRRLSVLPQGKNHGFIMFLDWSGSMSSELKSTMKQLLSMVLFCKRVQIPFEVYLFREQNELEAGGRINLLHERSVRSTKCFTYKSGDMELAAFKLRNILSSRMSLPELNRAFNILWYFASNNYSHVEPMGGTPLNQAIIAAAELVNQFRARNKLQVVNTVFLTDGGSNPIIDVAGRKIYIDPARHRLRQYIIQDEVTKKEYHMTTGRFDSEVLTKNLFRILKDRTDSNLVGFYLYSTWGRRSEEYTYNYFYPTSTNDKHKAEMIKSWKENKFMPVTSAGYDEYYVIDARSMKEMTNDLKVTGSMSKGKIAKAFLTFASKKAVNRVLLQRFINTISKVNAA